MGGMKPFYIHVQYVVPGKNQPYLLGRDLLEDPPPSLETQLSFILYIYVLVLHSPHHPGIPISFVGVGGGEYKYFMKYRYFMKLQNI